MDYRWHQTIDSLNIKPKDHAIDFPPLILECPQIMGFIRSEGVDF